MFRFKPREGSRLWQQPLPGRVAIALVVGHVILCTVRVPHSVFARRWQSVARYQEQGPARFHLDTRFHQGSDAVQWIRDHVPSDQIVLYRGQQKGALEFVPALIHPRLLVAEQHVEAGAATFAGRTIARHLDRPVVLVGADDRVEMVPR